MHQGIFKAYDIRGVYPREINEAAVGEIMRVVPRLWRKGKAVVGRDARLSSPSLYRAVIRAFKQAGVPTAEIGVATTPMFYFFVNRLKAAGGVMVTGSHTPREMNGLKVVKRGAAPISGTEILALMQKLKIKM